MSPGIIQMAKPRKCSRTARRSVAVANNVLGLVFVVYCDVGLM